MRRLGSARIALGLLGGLFLAACGRGPSVPAAPLAGFNLVLVNIDALRADHLGFEGYARQTSPFLDTLAARGVVFDAAHAASSYTRESVASLLTGQLPSHGGAAGWNAAPAPDAPHLGEILRAAGYRTGFFSNTVMLRNPGFTRGFDEVQHLPSSWNVSGEGPRLSERALRFARDNASRRFAMYLHYLDPHAPYEPAPELVRRFTSAELPPNLDLYRDVEPNLSALRASGFGPGEARFEAMVLRYDAEIAGTDAAIAQLVGGLEALGLADRTLLVVTADHGEEFLEHGWVEHGWTLYEESLRVPLLFYAPRALAPARVAARVSALDVVPSLLGLLGIAAPSARLDGAPLFSLDPGAATPEVGPRVQIAELLIPFRNPARAVTWGDAKYLAAQRWLAPEARYAADQAGASGAPPLDPAAPPSHEELYDLATDPGETRDQLAAAPERGREGRERLAASLGAAPAPRQAPVVPPEELERLRALGYH